MLSAKQSEHAEILIMRAFGVAPCASISAPDMPLEHTKRF